ncbi:cadmium-translocating P-type ATPase [Halocella sp. SP3-1]|nr:cadmium-translocating P-type ATPase [Halocella sp. SP3-1]
MNYGRKNIMAEAVLVKNEFKTKYILRGLACTSCAAKIEKAVQELPYVVEAELNLAASTIIIKGSERTKNMDKELQFIADKIENGVKVEKEGKRTLRQENNTSKKERAKDNTDITKKSNYQYRFWSGVGIFILALISLQVPILTDGFFNFYFKYFLFGSSYLLIGSPVLIAAFKNIKRGQVFDENFLMSIATLGAFAIQEFPEGVAVMLFYMVGEMFQEKAVDHSRRSIKDLMDIRPDYANLKQGEKTIKIAPEDVQVGDIIVIKPGERVPLDGEVLKGSSLVDTSALTGESVPRRVKSGEEILSGMINKTGLLTVKVNKEYNQSTVAQILDLVENASAKKAAIEKFITKFSRYYTPVVVYSALAIAILPPLFLAGASFSDWLYRSLIFLVVSCPCALVVSIPLGFFGGIGRASRQGILVKGGNYLEALNDVKQIVFDKTGTLTKGEFVVSKIKPYNNHSKDEILIKAAYAESHSTHPIAKSILEACEYKIDNNKIEDYQEFSGRGIKAVIDGQEVLVGNNKLMDQEQIDYQEVTEEATEATIVYIAIDNVYAGYITIADHLKDDSLKAIKALKQAGIREITMFTGDRENVAQEIAKRLGLDNYYAELLPAQKVEKVEELLKKQDKKDKLIFVGDGINDAPVLARSDIGVAMGGLGSDAAIEAADVVLMTDEPSKLVTAINTAHKTRQIIWQNIIFALGIKGIVLIMGTLGIATMWEAVFADAGVALLAVLNAMRISRNP